MPIVLDNTVGFLEAEVTESIDVVTHTLFIARIVACETLARDKEPMTYAYYRDIKQGKTPETAATYIKVRLTELDQKHKVHESLVYYLAVPPFLYTTIVEHLGSAGLGCQEKSGTKEQIKLVVEKPFGRDLQSAVELNDELAHCFNESQ
ncbi:unnamed protein product, partial [marine sediment metagenome]